MHIQIRLQAQQTALSNIKIGGAVEINLTAIVDRTPNISIEETAHDLHPQRCILRRGQRQPPVFGHHRHLAGNDTNTQQPRPRQAKPQLKTLTRDNKGTIEVGVVGRPIDPAIPRSGQTLVGQSAFVGSAQSDESVDTERAVRATAEREIVDPIAADPAAGMSRQPRYQRKAHIRPKPRPTLTPAESGRPGELRDPKTQHGIVDAHFNRVGLNASPFCSPRIDAEVGLAPQLHERVVDAAPVQLQIGQKTAIPVNEHPAIDRG